MRIISKRAITEFADERPDALEALLDWYHVAKRAVWRNLAEVHRDFPHAAVEIFAVFKIAGNKCRLITIIKYRWQVIYVRYILRHDEYNKEKWKQ